MKKANRINSVLGAVMLYRRILFLYFFNNCTLSVLIKQTNNNYNNLELFQLTNTSQQNKA